MLFSDDSICCISPLPLDRALARVKSFRKMVEMSEPDFNPRRFSLSCHEIHSQPDGTSTAEIKGSYGSYSLLLTFKELPKKDGQCETDIRMKVFFSPKVLIFPLVIVLLLGVFILAYGDTDKLLAPVLLALAVTLPVAAVAAMALPSAVEALDKSFQAVFESPSPPPSLQ